MACAKLDGSTRQECNLDLEKRAATKKEECKAAQSGADLDCAKKVKLAITEGTKACKRVRPAERKECLSQLKIQAAEQQAVCRQ